MKRRNFIKIISTAAFSLPAAQAFAQNAQAFQQLRVRLENAFLQKYELEKADPSQIEWISGISDGSCSSFDEWDSVSNKESE